MVTTVGQGAPKVHDVDTRQFTPRKAAWRSGIASLVAWGTFAASCDEVSVFARACIGCLDMRGVVLLDSMVGANACRALGITHVLHTAPLLPPEAHNVSNLDPRVEMNRGIDDFNYRYFKTPALFAALRRLAGDAEWYVKADCDAFVDLVNLGHLLINYWTHTDATYIGKPIRLWKYRGQRLTFMQGGAWAVSARGGDVLARCVRLLIAT